MNDIHRLLRVFLCHASSDKLAVIELFDRLVKDGIDPWLGTEKLLPGQDWQIEIPKAVRNSDAVIVCLSSRSVTKEGFVQKEIRIALDEADKKPQGTIFVIPARFENCKVPERIVIYQWVDLYSRDGYKRLFESLQKRADNLGITIKRRKTTVSVFISYHSSVVNHEIVDDQLSPSLRSIGCEVFSAMKMSRTGLNKSPRDRARELISASDVFIAIATPDQEDKKPSIYIMDEVAYARGIGKSVFLFVERNTNIPDPWKASCIYTEFDITEPGTLIRDVLKSIEKAK